MKKILLVVAALSLTLSAYAGEGKKVTLEGTGVCAKCELASAESCTNVLQVKNDKGEMVNYIFAKNISHGKYFCRGATPGLTVTGTFVEKDGKLILTATSVEKKEG